MEENAKFPPRVSRPGKSYVWPEEEIDAWVENKEAIARETMARDEAIARTPS